MTSDGRIDPEAYFFDLDGTLIDSIPGIRRALAEAFLTIGRTMPEADLRSAIGPPICQIAQRIEPTLTEEETQAIERAFRPLYDVEGWRETAVFEGVLETLRSLNAAEYRLFVVTNKPRIPALKILDHLGLATIFEGVLTRDSTTPHYASKAAMLGDLIADRSLPASACIMVGDTLEDHAAADAHGMPFVLARYGYGDDPSAHTIIDRFADLIPATGAQTAFQHERNLQTT